ncbi:hypothetical protein [Pararhodobacter sp. SW119]|uniref:hypothetical protein n=1 Tax=Pararhodobacter sp. SW119 TaxID=2780075 RepID=UPI001FD7BF43|nr:hypothetical protein [Pararhodobacter sp. SW119]
MDFRTLGARAAALAAALTLALAAPAAAEPGRLTIELNKFEETEDAGCRAFFLFRNETELTLAGFEMSLAILDRQGVIDRLLTIDAAPLPAARTTLKLFEIPGTRCDAISEILLHDLPSCQPQNADEMDCFPLLDLVSRTGAAMVN